MRALHLGVLGGLAALAACAPTIPEMAAAPLPWS